MALNSCASVVLTLDCYTRHTFNWRVLMILKLVLLCLKKLRSFNGRLIRARNLSMCRSQWPCYLRHTYAAALLLRSWVRIPPGAWMFICCECCVLSGRGLCDELITRPEESYRLWCVVVCDLETSRMRRPWPALGRSAKTKKKTFDVFRSNYN